MNLKKQKTTPLILLAFLILVYVSGIKISESLNHKRREYKNYTEKFEKNLSSSINILEEKIDKLTKDLKSSKNYNVLETNESKRIFQSYLDLGKIDSLKLYSEQCKNRQSYTLYERTLASCKNIENSNIEWLSLNKQPVLLLTKKITINNQNYYLQGQVYINQTWLKKTDGLFEELQSNGLIILTEKTPVESKEILLYTSNIQGRGEKPALGTEDSFAAIFSQFWTKETGLSSRDFNFLFFIIISLVFFILIKTKLSNSQNNEILVTYNHWIQEAVNVDNKDLYKICLNEDKKDLQHSNFFVNKTAKLLLKFLDKSVKSQKESSQLALQLQESIEYGKKLKQGQQKLSQLEALAEEMKTFCPNLLTQLKESLSHLEDSQEVLQKSSNKSCQLVLSHLSEWQYQAKEKGYRKYLRSLSETEGSHKDTSLLEEQISFFKDNLLQISGQIDYCSQILLQSQKQEQALIETMSTWFNFIETPTKQQEISLLETLQASKKLFFLREKSNLLKINIAIDPLLTISSKESKAKIISSFHYIFRFFSLKKEAAELNVNFKQKGLSQKLLFTCFGKDKRIPTKEINHLLDFSQNLLDCFDIDQESMKLDDENTLLCLSWNAKELIKMNVKKEQNFSALSLDH